VPHTQVGILLQTLVGGLDEAHRRLDHQLTAPRLRPASLERALTQEIEFVLAHTALEAQQQSIVGPPIALAVAAAFSRCHAWLYKPAEAPPPKPGTPEFQEQINREIYEREREKLRQHQRAATGEPVFDDWEPSWE